MKKTLYYFLFLASTSGMLAQTFVSTIVEKKKPLLEKFTGTNCGACPGGDAVIQNLKLTHGDDITVFAHHTFNTDPDDFFNIDLSPDIASQSMATGYPAASINREIFSDWSQNAGGSAMSSSNWSEAVDLELMKDAYVNVAAKLNYDIEYNKFLIDVEIYYTGTPTTVDQRLNIALVQDSVLGPQSGGGMGEEYIHNHMIRDLITGQWGEMLADVEQGTFIERQFEIDIPSSYGIVNVIPENMEIVVFVTEGQTIVANSTHAKPVTFVNHTLNPSIKDNGVSVCGTDVKPIIELTNYGTETLTDIEFKYYVNGTEYSYDWSGSLESLDNESIVFPSVTYTNLSLNTFKAEIVNTNNVGADDAAYNNVFEFSFNEAVQTSSNTNLKIKLDGWGSDITWRILDQNSNVYYTGGPYEDGNDNLISKSFNLDTNLCYRFEIIDKSGNGLEGGQNSSGTYFPAGYFKFEGVNLFKEGSSFGDKDLQYFSIDMNTVSVTEIELSKLDVFPNPSHNQFIIDLEMQSPGEITYTISNTLGVTVHGQVVTGGTGKNGIIVDHDLPIGIYYLQVSANGVDRKMKLIVE